MDFHLHSVEIDPEIGSIESLFFNFHLSEKGEYYMKVFLENGEWKPYEVYHDYDRNTNYDQCPFCQSELKEGGGCWRLNTSIHALYNTILEQPNIKLRALYKGLRKIERETIDEKGKRDEFEYIKCKIESLEKRKQGIH